MRNQGMQMGFYGFNKTRPVIKWLIIVNAVIFLLQLILNKFAQFPVEVILGIVPTFVVQKFWVWQLFTYMFLHGHLWHLLFNMFFLWMFGNELAYLWGDKEFFRYFLVCGIGAGIFNLIVSAIFIKPAAGDFAIILGSSGAVYGLLMAYALFFGERVLYFMLLFPMKAKHFVLIIGAIEFIMSVFYTNDGIAHLAHLGGMVFGFAYIYFKYVGKARKKKKEQERKDEIRRKFKVIVNPDHPDNKGRGSDDKGDGGPMWN